MPETCVWTPVLGDRNILTPACDLYEMFLRTDAQPDNLCPSCKRPIVFEEPDNADGLPDTR